MFNNDQVPWLRYTYSIGLAVTFYGIMARYISWPFSSFAMIVGFTLLGINILANLGMAIFNAKNSKVSILSPLGTLFLLTGILLKTFGYYGYAQALWIGLVLISLQLLYEAYRRFRAKSDQNDRNRGL